jgi:enoyl-CoA hydratase/carnithine racemase
LEDLVVKKTVLFEKSGGVGIISLNRPEADNAINSMMIAEFSAICADISLDSEIKVVIVTGTGAGAFCAGIDPDELDNVDEKLVKGQLSLATPLAALSCPTIAAINGNAFGQGLELALACDLRIAIPGARLGVHHIGQGYIPWDGATQRLPRVIGMPRAMEMVLTGKEVTAEEAYEISLVTKIVASDELTAFVKDIAQTMTTKSPLALSFAKEAINNGMDLTLEQGLRLEADLYFLLHTTEDRIEGIKAFREKRTPEFKGK